MGVQVNAIFSLDVGGAGAGMDVALVFRNAALVLSFLMDRALQGVGWVD